MDNEHSRHPPADNLLEDRLPLVPVSCCARDSNKYIVDGRTADGVPQKSCLGINYRFVGNIRAHCDDSLAHSFQKQGRVLQNEGSKRLFSTRV
jgi:hypothetical protein